MNLGGGDCSELRSHHCTPAWATESDSISKKKKERKSIIGKILGLILLGLGVSNHCLKHGMVSAIKKSIKCVWCLREREVALEWIGFQYI